MEKSRLDFLEEAVKTNPDDTFARYALALELSSSDRPEAAWPHFEYLLSHHPDYSATYYQAGTFLAKQNRRAEARRVFEQGIRVTLRQGNSHAQSELQSALAALEE